MGESYSRHGELAALEPQKPAPAIEHRRDARRRRTTLATANSSDPFHGPASGSNRRWKSQSRTETGPSTPATRQSMRQRASSPDTTNAKSAFVPKTYNGVAHRSLPRTSIDQWQAASTWHAMPPVKST